MMRRILPFLFVIALIAVSRVDMPATRTYDFDDPIDAISVGIPEAPVESGKEDTPIGLDVSALVDGAWTPWQEFAIETEFDPLLTESNLVIFPKPVEKIRVRGTEPDYEIHPIRVSHDPPKVEVAASTPVGMPRMLTRAQWGADESLLIEGGDTSRSDVDVATLGSENGNASSSQRVQDCTAAHAAYPEEFLTEGKTETTPDGKKLRWAREYSPIIRLLVVHHTALTIKDDPRPAVERMRALYTYHTNSRGWGDIGYHYIIDEKGQIYEGKSGGDKVVGGHVYCGNPGTIGVALMGNFDMEQPTQAQMQMLQWLLLELTRRYNLDPDQSVVFHGKTMPVIVGHKDLVATSCPGYYVRETIAQVRSHVAAGAVEARVVFPTLAKGYKDNTKKRLAVRSTTPQAPPLSKAPTLSAVGSTTIEGPPGRQASLRLKLTAGAGAMLRRSRIATVERSDPRIGLWQDMDGRSGSIQNELLLQDQLPARATISLTVRVQLPDTPGRSTVRIGDITFELLTKSDGQVSTPPQITLSASPDIRIRLTAEEGDLRGCAAAPIATLRQRYRGTIACTLIEGKPALINTLPMEDYLAGLAEEPDSEPFEKQRAFAVAARSYAAHYLDPQRRKFPGMPYDGDDSAARFQLYKGIIVEQNNPAWVRAVRSTAGLVLKKNGEIVKTAYFSSDDGRTRTPAENGWGNYPFAEVFVSKPDPWCAGMPMRGHGVGMSGCGAKGQALEGTKAEDILRYYYPGTLLEGL